MGSVLKPGAAFWFLAGLGGMIAAAAAMTSDRFSHLPALARVTIAVGLGWAAMLALAPWRQILRKRNDREEIRRITGMVRRFEQDQEREPLGELLSDGDDEISDLRRAIHDALSGAAAHRLEARHLRRTMDDSIRRETTRATGRLRKEATTDSLTGLGNRRALEGELADHLEAAREAGLPLTALLLDLDGFKQINDRLGHPAGDACLAFLGTLLRGGLREGDRAFRSGGDEFVVLMPGQPSDVGHKVAARLQALFAQMAWPHEKVARPTLSIGIATAQPDRPHDPQDLIRSADRAMYESKREKKAVTPGSSPVHMGE